MGPGMGGGPPHLEAGKWRSAIAALSGRGMPGRNPQETLDFALTDKKKLTDLCLVRKSIDLIEDIDAAC